MRIFVSSTRQDMDTDCRPGVLKAIKYFEGNAVTMEDWASEYQPALQLCREKISQSSHYLGVFGYYRGWTPPGLMMSITEAELEWARGLPLPIAVFLPDENHEIAGKLEARAKGKQTEEQSKAQREFLAMVKANGGVELFEDVVDLALRAARRVKLWLEPLTALTPSGAAPSKNRPGPQQLRELGRAEQLAGLKKGLLSLESVGARPAIAFLVHGAKRFGHERLIGRLEAEIEGGAAEQPRILSIGCGVLWRQNGLASLLTALGNAVRPGWKPATVETSSEAVGKLLSVQDVVLRVTQLELFEGGVAGFLDLFWTPLLKALPETSASGCRLIALLTHEGEEEPVVPASAAPAQGPGGVPFVSLPRLGPLTHAEVSSFVRRWGKANKVAVLSDALMAATQGAPDLLCEVLLKESTWEE